MGYFLFGLGIISLLAEMHSWRKRGSRAAAAIPLSALYAVSLLAA